MYLEDENMIYITADTHFGDENIIRYEKRPFYCTAYMDDVLISNWNNVVKENDTTFILGDFARNDYDYNDFIIRRLNGHKILIKGNHDNLTNRQYLKMGFDNVYDYPIILEDFYVLQHKPPEYINSSSPFAYIFGHVHKTPLYKSTSFRALCACTERWDFKPISFDLCKELIKKEE